MRFQHPKAILDSVSIRKAGFLRLCHWLKSIRLAKADDVAPAPDCREVFFAPTKTYENNGK
jgi:hypothetical protein